MEQEKVRTAVGARWSGEILLSLAGLVEIPALARLRPGLGGQRAAGRRRGTRPGLDRPPRVARGPDRRHPAAGPVPAAAGRRARDRGRQRPGHGPAVRALDKQPPVGGWADGLGPWRPVFRDGRLYGRGAVDDGYAGYAATAALEAVHAAAGQHARAVMLLETGEESGSPDLPAYMERLADRLGEVTFVVCLDGGVVTTSGCG